jgi:hypothetical protein
MVNRIIADTTRPSPGDPVKMVEAMITSVDQEPTPRRRDQRDFWGTLA